MAAKNHHILLVTFPAQGHINPSLQFAKRLSKLGVAVTFLTSLSAVRRMTATNNNSSSPSSTDGAAPINFASFRDGFDDGWSSGEIQNFMSALRTHGTKAVEDAISAAAAAHRPFSRVIYSLLVPWAGQAAHRLQVPVTLLWIQPAILFGVYFYYFNKYFDAAATNQEEITDHSNKPIIELPGLPPFAPSDLPSFMQTSNPSIYDFALPTFTENFEILDRETSPPTVLVNSFDSLESEALTAIKKYKLTAIGPLIPSAFLDGKDPSDTSFGGDLIKQSSSSQDYLRWLDSKEKSSVIYVAFGSYSEISEPQMVEIAKGLIKIGKPFLWVIRGAETVEKLDGIFSVYYREELEKLGKIVGWCTQVEVLSHASVGCFLTHCGWNSTLESLVSGVPVVGFPQWTDQTTNAKLVEDFWRCGVRVNVSGGGGGIVEGDEIERCLGVVMGGGDRAEEMRRWAEKWRGLAKEAVEEDGSSTVNLKSFVDEVLD